MPSDEEILQKATLLLENILTEMIPSEREHLGDWLYQNDPANLPFNDAFKGKMGSELHALKLKTITE